MAYIEMSYKSAALTREVQIQVILPSHEGIGDSTYPCKTVYLLHGFNGNGAELTRFLPLMIQSMLTGMAIIAVLSPCINFYEVTALDETPFTETVLNPIFGSRERYENSDQCCEGAVKKAVQEKGVKIWRIKMKL